MSQAVFSALIETMLVHLVIALSMFFAHIIFGKRVPGTRYWFTAALATAFGYGFYAAAPHLPDFLAYTLPNTFLASSIIAAVGGAAALSGRKISGYLLLVAEVIAILLFIVFGILNPSFHTRSLVISVISVFGTICAAYYLFVPVNPNDRPVTVAGGVTFAVSAVVYSVRFVLLLVSNPIQGGVTTPEWYVLFMNISLALYVWLGISFFLMVGGLLTRSLERSLHENTLLLTEIRHRTKNNLALIGSLISLQSDGISDSGAKSAFKELSERLRTITTMYRMLSRVEDGHNADAKRYLDALAAGIRDSIIAGRKQVEFCVYADSCMLDAKQLVSMGLIVNELATNSLKYAFPHSEGGLIRLEFKIEGDNCLLSFSDNGVGLEEGSHRENSNEATTEGLGLTLVRSLVGQLRGKLHVESKYGKGTFYTLRFPAKA
ncbi:MAG: sensor histidine kinase [Treponemataceae bacterium]